MTTLRDLAESAAVCTPEQIAEAYREIRIPVAPFGRSTDELSPIPEPKPSERVENAALVVASLALLAGFFL